MPNYDDPACPLSEVIEKAKAGSLTIRKRAEDDAKLLELTRDDIIEVLQALKPEDFHHSMDSKVWVGTRQDVYGPTHNGVKLYVKIQYWPVAEKHLFVASFKKDTP